VRNVDILRNLLDPKLLACMHRRRVETLWRLVTGLILGGKACSAALGRSLPGLTSDKHKIKTVDRFLGNEALHREVNLIYQALAHALVMNVRMPVIAVDWTGAGAHHNELSAKLCSDGRALPLYSQVYAKKKYVQADAHRAFLHELSQILPIGCEPVLVTDAGFHHAWFSEVRRYNWHYIGRVRGASQVVLGGPFAGKKLTLKQVHGLARTQAKDLGNAIVSAGTNPHGYRMVLSRQPRRKGRKRLTRQGKAGRNHTDKSASRGAREPWILVTSLQVGAASVVYGYSLRMQIEESFRDHKSTRHGWCMRQTVTRSAERMSVMLMIASLADIVVQTAGRVHASSKHGSGLQANTIRKKRVLSFVFHGCSACRRGLEFTTSQLQAALKELVRTLAKHGARFVLQLRRRAARPRPSARYVQKTPAL
jgi:hypothetical protein